MKKLLPLLSLQIILSFVSGFLISKMPWIGRIGITWFMRKYLIFKSWWQTALLLLIIQIVIIFLLWMLRKTLPPKGFVIILLVFIAAAITGLCFTFHDFQTTFTHRLMREKFHLGFYLFWLSSIISCLYFLFTKEKSR